MKTNNMYIYIAFNIAITPRLAEIGCPICDNCGFAAFSLDVCLGISCTKRRLARAEQ